MAIETPGTALRQINRLFTDGAITGFSNAQLLERFVSGRDAAAFEALVTRYGPMVASVCRGIFPLTHPAKSLSAAGCWGRTGGQLPVPRSTGRRQPLTSRFDRTRRSVGPGG